MKYLLVDGTNLVVRASHAAQSAPLTSEDGTPTATLLIFVNSLSRVVREEEPTHVVVCWDGGKSVYRREIWEGYKANRNDAPDSQPERPMEQVKTFCTLAGIHHIERDGFEADDLIANYRRQIKPIDSELVIFSGDKDFLQLVDTHCILIRPMNGGAPFDRWTAERMEAELGCKPEHYPYVKALMGDVSDGIPGLKGVGPKRAVKMMEKADWSWLRLIDGGLAEEDRELLLRNDRLMNIRYHVPYTPLSQPPAFRPNEAPVTSLPGEMLDYLDRYGLASVLVRMRNGTLWKDLDLGEA